MTGRRRRRQSGQATVEVAILLPLVLGLVLLVVQVGLVARYQVLVIDGARGAARAVAVGGGQAEAEAAAGASGLDPERLAVELRSDGDPSGRGRGWVTAVVRYQLPTLLPGSSGLGLELPLEGRVTMRIE